MFETAFCRVSVTADLTSKIFRTNPLIVFVSMGWMVISLVDFTTPTLVMAETSKAVFQTVGILSYSVEGHTRENSLIRFIPIIEATSILYSVSLTTSIRTHFEPSLRWGMATSSST